MNTGRVEVGWEQNVKRVKSFLGLVLIVAFTYYMYTLLRDAMQDIMQSAHTSDALQGVGGTIRLTKDGVVFYDDIVSFRTTSHGLADGSTTYMTVTCFQGDKMVYQRSTQGSIPLRLTDQPERDMEWNGSKASCSATLMYRTAGAGVYALDTLSFEVGAKNP